MAKTDLLGFSLDLPDQWMGVQAIWLGPFEKPKAQGLMTVAPQAAFRENIAFHISPNTKVSAVEYLTALSKQMVEVQTVKKEPAELEANTASMEVITKSPQGIRMRQIVHATVAEDKTAVLTFSFLEGSSDVKEKRAFFDEVLASRTGI